MCRKDEEEDVSSYWMTLRKRKERILEIEKESTMPTLFPVHTLYWGYRIYFAFLNPEEGTDTLSRIVGTNLPLLVA
jgi:hypothetical protein